MDSSAWEHDEAFFKAVTHARKLRRLYVSQSSGTLMEQVLSSNLDLCELKLSYCESFELPNTIPKLKSLTTLDLEEISSFDSPMLSSLVQLAPNLHRLRIDCVLYQEADLSCLLQLQQLQEFVLNLPGLPKGSLTDLLVKYGENKIWPHLISLELHSIEKEDMEFVRWACPQLRHLRLTDCFTGSNLANIFSSLRGIETLWLSRLDTLTEEALGAMQEEARRSLQELSIIACPLLSSPKFNSEMNCLPNLKRLSILGCPDVRVDDSQGYPFAVSLGVSKQYSAM